MWLRTVLAIAAAQQFPLIGFNDVLVDGAQVGHADGLQMRKKHRLECVRPLMVAGA